MALEQLGRRKVAGSLLLLNLLMYVFMLGFAGWALNSSIKNAGVDAGWGTSTTPLLQVLAFP
uniref:Uncharacterized protein n=1 Tax=Oryza brachyantha TaxID=4533 RepID=J3N382_ORYBR